MKKLALAITAVALLTSLNAYGFINERTSSGIPIYWNLNEESSHVSGGKVIFYLNQNCSADYVTPAEKTNCLNTLEASLAHWTKAQISTTNFDILLPAPLTTQEAVPKTMGDNINLLVFVSSGLGSGVIALTTTWYSTNPIDYGRITDSDIQFNDTYNFLSGTDLETVATHELGHTLGLDHSFVRYVGAATVDAITSTMYFQYFGINARSLEWDDIAGVSSIYPDDPGLTFYTNYGVISGNVAYADSPTQGVFGAHILLLEADGSAGDGTPIVATVTNKSGNYQLEGCPPGTYEVMLEALTPSNVSYNLGPYYSTAQTGFKSIIWDGHVLTSRADAAPGATIFDTAERIVMTAEQSIPNINFLVGGVTAPPLPPVVAAGTGGGSHKHSSCTAAGDGDIDGGMVVLFLVPFFWFLLFRRRRRQIA